MEDFQAFARIRAEAATWCLVEGKRSALRSLALRPGLSEWPTPEEFGAALQALQGQRHELLADRTLVESPMGRLLVCGVNESLSSGESGSVTSGFFDVNDRPPWDTWLWQLPVGSDAGSVTLVSWVPPELEHQVTEGIHTNPYGCIFWLSDAPFSKSPFVKELLAAGFDPGR